MTTRYLNGIYAHGYTLSADYSKLVIERSARVHNRGGVGVTAAFSATVINRGRIDSTEQGVVLEAGGALINGAERLTSASITGDGVGLIALGVATIANFGTIAADILQGAGVDLRAGGSILNGSTRDTAALIYGYFGIDATGAPVTIANFGTIRSGAYYEGGAAVSLAAGGSITNGSASDTTALIHAGRFQNAIVAGAVATVENFGTIDAGQYEVAGVVLSGGLITNGSTHDSTALIYGAYGVRASGAAATIINFGTIYGGAYDVSVLLSSPGGKVIAEAGSTFIGRIEGGGGTLDLAGGGTGTISGLGDGGTLTGAVQASFIHVDTVVIEAGGSWTLAGPNKVDPVADLVDAGTLINAGALTIAGTVSIDAGGVFRLAGGSIAAGPEGDARIVDNGLVIKNAGRGTITVAAHMFDRGVVEVATGTLDFTSRLFGTGVLKIDAGATLEADAGAVSTLTATFAGGAATLALKRPNTFAATLAGFATGDVIDLLALKATGASVNGADQMVVVDGARTVATLQLSGAYAGATFTTAADGHGGTNVALAPGVGPDLASVHGTAPVMAPTAAPLHAFIFAMAGLGGTTASHATPGAPWAPRATLLSAPRNAMV